MGTVPFPHLFYNSGRLGGIWSHLTSLRERGLIEFSDSDLKEHVRIFASAAVAWLQGLNQALLGNLGIIWKAKVTVGRREADSVTRRAWSWSSLDTHIR